MLVVRLYPYGEEGGPTGPPVARERDRVLYAMAGNSSFSQIDTDKHDSDPPEHGGDAHMAPPLTSPRAAGDPSFVASVGVAPRAHAAQASRGCVQQNSNNNNIRLHRHAIRHARPYVSYEPGSRVPDNAIGTVATEATEPHVIDGHQRPD